MVRRMINGWTLMAAPFLGAFVAHPCLEHFFFIILGVGVAALGLRKPHCCKKDHHDSKVGNTDEV